MAARQPWEILDGEGDAAFEAFTIYSRLIPSERSAAKACELYWANERRAESGRKTTSSRSTQFSEWCAKFSWVDRARALDNHRALVEQEAWDNEMRRLTKGFVKKQSKALDLFLDRLTEFLSYPMSERVVSNPIEVGGQIVYQTVTIKPIETTASGLASLGSYLDKVVRLDNGDVTDRTEVTGTLTVDKVNDIRERLDKRIAERTPKPQPGITNGVH